MTRLTLWLNRGDNAFNLAMFIIAPPLFVIVAIGFVGVPS